MSNIDKERKPPKHGWHPGFEDPLKLKMWEIRHQLDINSQTIRNVHPEAATAQIGHTIDILQQHVYERLDELERMIQK